MEKDGKRKLEIKSSKVLKNIVEKRQELGLTQWDLSQKLNLSANGYFKVETGKTKLDVNRLLEIAEALNVSPAVFFED